MAATRFPGPYQNDTKVDSSLMKYVPFDKMDIAANSASLPKGDKVKSSSMGLSHVGDSTPGPISNKFPS